MNNLGFVLIGLVFISISLILSALFNLVLFEVVEHTWFGWSLSTLIIRLTTATCMGFGLVFSTKGIIKLNLKKWLFFIIGFLIGFSINFAFTPIYDVDYFMHADKKDFKHLNKLGEQTKSSYRFDETYQVLAFLDLGCGHCMETAQRLGVNYYAGQKVPVHLFFNGDEQNINHFRTTFNVENYPFHRIENEHEFLYYAGFEFPSLYLVEPSGEVVYHWVGKNFNYTALDYLLSLEQ